MSSLVVCFVLFIFVTSLRAQIERPARLVLIQSVTTTEPDVGFGNPTYATVKVTGEEIIEIGEDEYLEVDNLKFASDSPTSYIDITKSGVQVELGGEALPYVAVENEVVVGPATCRLYCEYRNNPANQTSKLTYVANILITSGITSLDGLQSDSFGRLVIPENAGGSVTVILEQSADLINWTGANPGTYDPIDDKRFFRIRATIGN